MTRLTRQQTAIMAALSNREDFVSAQQLHADMAGHGHKVGLATVYRALQNFDEGGTVDSVQGHDGESRYRACRTERHHHHLMCRDCGKAVEIDGPAVEEWSERIGARYGFTEIDHTVELFGRCAECA